MTYYTFRIMFADPDMLMKDYDYDVVAISPEAALADLHQAYDMSGLRFVCIRNRGAV